MRYCSILCSADRVKGVCNEVLQYIVSCCQSEGRL
jgi:hypothetical protein